MPCHTGFTENLEDKRNVEKMLRQRGCKTASTSALQQIMVERMLRPFNRGFRSSISIERAFSEKKNCDKAVLFFASRRFHILFPLNTTSAGRPKCAQGGYLYNCK